MNDDMKILIRPVKKDDAEAINSMRRRYNVMRNTLALSSDRLEKTTFFLDSLGENDYAFVAEVDNNDIRKVIAYACLHVNSSPRLRHSADVGINVDEDYHSKGIGTKIMEQLLDIADNWLMLARVELEVIADNEKGLNLYKKLGFQIEGIKKYAVIRDGKFEDVYMMGRYNKTIIK